MVGEACDVPVRINLMQSAACRVSVIILSFFICYRSCALAVVVFACRLTRLL